MEDAANQFDVTTAEQAKALQEELQSWYFSNGENINIEIGGGGNANYDERSGINQQDVEHARWSTPEYLQCKPPVDVLEEAAAAVKAKVVATDVFRIPPPQTGSFGDYGYSAHPGLPAGHRWPQDRPMPGRNSSGCRAVAAATANRMPLGTVAR